LPARACLGSRRRSRRRRRARAWPFRAPSLTPRLSSPFPPPKNPLPHKPQGDDKGDRVTLSREEEPDEYWVSASEKKGANPLKDPLAWVGIAAIFFPFFLLLVAIATGLVDVSVYR
jgi:hypothetical protein